MPGIPGAKAPECFEAGPVLEAPMRHTTVQDVMTTEVVTVTATTPYKEVVQRLSARGLSAAPVIDDHGRPVGIVSETDLLAKQANPESSSSRRCPLAPWRRADRRKAMASDAGALMTVPPMTIHVNATVVDAAARMRRDHVDELPVVDHLGRLVGIVTRSDLLAVFLRQDEDVRSNVREDILRHLWWLNPDVFRVEVHDGVVTIAGELEREAMVEELCRDILSVDGVVGVASRLTWRLSEHDARRIPVSLLRG